MAASRSRRSTGPLRRAAAGGQGSCRALLLFPLLLTAGLAEAASAEPPAAAAPAADGQSEAPEDEDVQAMLQIHGAGRLENVSEVEDWRVWSSALPAETVECIEKEVRGPRLLAMIENFKGGGENPATICAVVPEAGKFTGLTGNVAVVGVAAPIPTWSGKELKECTKTSNGTCVQRDLINRFVDNQIEFMRGHWFISNTSWIDGKPAAHIEYPNFQVGDLGMHDDLRPWCACGVRMFLGLVFLAPGTPPTNSFVMVPPDAKPDSCPRTRSEATMCNP